MPRTGRACSPPGGTELGSRCMSRTGAATGRRAAGRAWHRRAAVRGPGSGRPLLRTLASGELRTVSGGAHRRAWVRRADRRQPGRDGTAPRGRSCCRLPGHRGCGSSSRLPGRRCSRRRHEVAAAAAESLSIAVCQDPPDVLAALLERPRLLVGNESGPLHLAAVRATEASRRAADMSIAKLPRPSRNSSRRQRRRRLGATRMIRSHRRTVLRRGASDSHLEHTCSLCASSP